MSAYASLASLRRTLPRVFIPQAIHSGAKLRFLQDEAGSLLRFLDAASSTHISELETKIRDAAQKAEDLIECGLLDSYNRFHPSLTKVAIFVSLLGFIFTTLNKGVARYAGVIPVWIQNLLVEAFCCTINAVALYLLLRLFYVFPALGDSQELRRVLYDFNIIAKDVAEISDAKMSARAALVSLRQVLDSVMDSTGPQPVSHDHLRSLHEKVSFLLDFVGNASSTNSMDARIRDATYNAKKALIEFQVPGKFALDLDWRRFSTLMNGFLFGVHAEIVVASRLALRMAVYGMSPKEIIPVYFGIRGQFCMALVSYIASIVIVHVVLAAQYNSVGGENQDLARVADDFGVIMRDAIKDKDGYGDSSDSCPPPAAAASSSSSRQDLGGSSRDVVVGLDSDLDEIKYLLFRDSSKRELSSIVGMGGIGKTTLARQVFKDPLIVSHFDVCAWVTVSQEYSLRSVLLCLLDSAQILKEEEKHKDSDAELALCLYQYLVGRRYLVVMDDAWGTDVWGLLSTYLPDNDNQSRVLLTTRLPNVASRLHSSSRLHQMHCLNSTSSWDLLSKKVFGAQSCPPELESVGNEIAHCCRGLPLAIAVIGGLLCNDLQIKVWREVAEKLKNLQLQDIKEQFLEILGLSYNHLPHHLRPCFLYMGVFMRDSEIPISRLIYLWVAEGFLEWQSSKTSEEVAEGYLEDLIDRNLIMVSKKSCNGKNRTCCIHDLLRDVCVRNARTEKFLHVVDLPEYGTRDRGDESPPRRLCIHPEALHGKTRHGWTTSYDSVRSVICFAGKPTENPSAVNLGFSYLRVLDVLEVRFRKFPSQITKLLLLRYLALHYNGSLPASIWKLRDLETLIHHHSSSCKHPLLPGVIWDMQLLRHIYVKPGCYLMNAPSYKLRRRLPVLSNLKTLVGIRNFKWTRGMIERFPNLKKLGISYDVSSSVDWSIYQLENIVYLEKLESLKMIVKYDDSAIHPNPPKLAFPQRLKKLSLSGCRIPWECMTTIGALPNLEALKLRCKAFSGQSWETVEGEFSKLVFLLLEEMSLTTWESEESHFPRLQRLVLRSCDVLKKIPRSFGDISTLEMIKLVDCQPSAVDFVATLFAKADVSLSVSRRREVEEMKVDARGGAAGRLQVLIDVIQSAGNEIIVAALVLLLGWHFLLRN